MTAMIWIWLGAVVVFAIVEAMTVGLTSIWFALGALGGFVAALAGAQLLVQLGTVCGGHRRGPGRDPAPGEKGRGPAKGRVPPTPTGSWARPPR